MSTLGDKLQQTLIDLQRALDDARRAREDVIAAWEEHDYDWLVSAGYLTQFDVENA
jgi:hypothetical protein